MHLLKINHIKHIVFILLKIIFMENYIEIMWKIVEKVFSLF